MSEHIILLIDADPALSERTRDALAPYGCRCELIADPNVALAYGGQPSLIVLCIDPKRTGWAVTNKLKKHPVLRTVPLIITSAEATEKDFEDHRKLKTRAEDYAHKPYQVEELVEKVRALLGLEAIPAAIDIGNATEELSADDAIEVVDEEQLGGSGSADFDDELSDRTKVADVGELLAQETDAAFANISASEAELLDLSLPSSDGLGGSIAEPVLSSAPPPRLVSGADAMPAPPPSLADPALDFFVPEPAAAADAVPQPIGPIGGAEPLPFEEDELANLREERDHLKRELQELRSRTPERSGPVVSSREVLNLRETINKKEKEILDLKDALDAKDREMLHQKERSREGDRSRRDLEDRALAVEKELIEAQEKMEALARDKELVQERERGIKGRLEDALKKVERAHAETNEWKNRHAADAEALRATQAAVEEAKAHGAAQLEEARAAAETARAALERAHADEKDALSTRLAGADARGRELEQAAERAREEHAQAIAAVEDRAKSLEKSAADAEARHKEELAAAERAGREEVARAEQAMRAALDAARAETARALEEAGAQKSRALDEAAQEKAKALDEAAQEKAKALEAAAAEKARALDEAAQDKAKALETAAEDKAQALRAAAAERDHALEEAAQEKSLAIDQAAAEKAKALAAAAADKEKALEEEAAEKAAAVAALGQAHEQAVADLKGGHARELEAVRGELEAARSDAAGLRDQLEAATSAGKQREAELEEARARFGERERSHAQAIEEMKAGHAEDVRLLGEQISELRAETESLRGRLDAETAARQQLETGLAEANAQLADREQRIAALEAEGRSYQEQILKAHQRLKNDETLVTRARKALAIALTLLDESGTAPDENKTS